MLISDVAHFQELAVTSSSNHFCYASHSLDQEIKKTVFLVINLRFRLVRRVFVQKSFALYPEPVAACHANQLG